MAETIDWVRTLGVLGEDDLTPQAAGDNLGAVIKDRDDLDLVRASLEEIVSGAEPPAQASVFSPAHHPKHRPASPRRSSASPARCALRA